jgi:hypothetical protein
MWSFFYKNRYFATSYYFTFKNGFGTGTFLCMNKKGGIASNEYILHAISETRNTPVNTITIITKIEVNSSEFKRLLQC